MLPDDALALLPAGTQLRVIIDTERQTVCVHAKDPMAPLSPDSEAFLDALVELSADSTDEEYFAQNKPTLTRETIQNTVIKMHAIRPSPLVDNYRQFIDKVDLPDRNDRHVLAAAIASLQAFGIVAESPDKFLSDLVNEQPAQVARVLRNMRRRRKKAAHSVDEFLEAMKRGGLGWTVRHLERYRDLL